MSPSDMCIPPSGLDLVALPDQHRVDGLSRGGITVHRVQDAERHIGRTVEPHGHRLPRVPAGGKRPVHPWAVSASRPSRRLVVSVTPGRRSPVCVRHAQAGGAGTTLQLPTGGEFETSGGHPACNLAVKQDGLWAGISA